MSAQSSIKLLGISGSLRKQSYNSGALNAIASLLPDGMTFITADLSSLPFYNADIEQRGLPDAVQKIPGGGCGRGCADLCRAGVQFLTSRGSQECPRMAFAAACAARRWQALCCVRRFRKSARHRKGAVSFSSRRRFAQHDHGECAARGYQQRQSQVRRREPPHRSSLLGNPALLVTELNRLTLQLRASKVR